MKILKNRFKFLLVALSALVLPSNGYCYDNVYESQLRDPSVYYPFMAMALGLVCVLLVFAVIFYAISHKTKREKMHIELLVEMVRHGLLPTSEQVASKSVVDDISFDDKGNIMLKKKAKVSFPKILLIAVGILWLFCAMETSGDISAMLGIAGSFVFIYAIMDIKNVAFWQRNISTLNIINLVIGFGALLIGLWKSNDFAESLIPYVLPGGFLIYYAVNMLSVYDKMPHFEFKIKKVERRDVENRDNETYHDDSESNIESI